MRRIELNAGGLGGAVSVSLFQTELSGMMNHEDALTSCFRLLEQRIYNLNGGVGVLQGAADNLESSAVTAEARAERAQEFQQKADQFLTEAIEADKQVASLVAQNQQALYKAYPQLAPPPPPQKKEWYDYLADCFKSAGEWLQGAWNGVVDFFASNGVFQMIASGTEMLVGGILVVVGAGSLILSGGLSTPLAICAIAGGTGMIAHGSGGFQEGWESFHGAENPHNWLRDLVGNTWYNVIGYGSMIIGSFAGGVQGLLILGGSLLAGAGARKVGEWFGIDEVWLNYLEFGVSLLVGLGLAKGYRSYRGKSGAGAKDEGSSGTETPKVEEGPKTETPKVEEGPKTETPKGEESPKTETPKGEEAPKTETPKGEESPKTEAPKGEETPKTAEPKTYPKSILDEVTRPDGMTDKAMKHVFEGNSRTGYHYEGIEGTDAHTVPGTETPPDANGVYDAQVEFSSGPKKGNGGNSTFFPKEWSPQEVLDTIGEAKNKANPSNVSDDLGWGKMHTVKIDNGMTIEILIKNNGEIVTAYPVYSP